MSSTAQTGNRCVQRSGKLVACLTAALIAVTARAGAADVTAPEAVEYFETEVRPLLVEHCQECHGGDEPEARLRLDSRQALLSGGESGPAIVPDKPDESLLIRAVEYLGDLKMPPDGKLSDTEIAALRRWVEMGAPWPDNNSGAESDSAAMEFQVTAAQQAWWAFQPVSDPPAPESGGVWPQGDIDRFVYDKMQVQGLQPAAPADRRTWLRRTTFDLTGLPPTPDEVSAFLADGSDGAAARVVDRLLASPAYGQRWARHWLDVARYADYYDANPATRVASCELTEAWRYRDWIVDALNEDLPFDQFIMHQIAGDLLASPTGEEVYPEGLIATTFLTNGVWDRGDADKEKIVSDMADDNIDIIGKAFLGLTLGCARCHDHKFDPVSTKDYYGLAGIFYSSHILANLGAKGGEYTMNRVPLVPASLVAQRAAQVQELAAIDARLNELNAAMAAADDPQRIELTAQRDRLQQELLPEPPLAMAMQEGGTPGGLFPGIQDVPIHIRGSYARLGPVVSRGLPEFFAGADQPPIEHGSGRLRLASWVASPENPLTARVIVNRVWQWHFGAGLVTTPNNFGMLSEPPSHPQLLDWLASRFMEDGWSLKRLHRRIMLSATYQQASASADAAALDPANRWLARFTPWRLEAEALRDAMFAVSGRLNFASGGPAADDISTDRRSLYVQTARWDRGSFAILFDAANPDASVATRDVSTVAPQSLFLLNHPLVLEQAAAFATRLQRDVLEDDASRIAHAYELLYARPPTAAERQIALEIIDPGEAPTADQGWIDLAHVLLCSNEFVYID
jgi:hypothetical protein